MTLGISPIPPSNGLFLPPLCNIAGFNDPGDLPNPTQHWVILTPTVAGFYNPRKLPNPTQQWVILTPTVPYSRVQ